MSVKGYIATLLNRLPGDIRQSIQAAFDALQTEIAASLVETSAGTFGFGVDGGGAVPTAQSYAQIWRAPAAGTITRITVIGDAASGSAVVDVRKRAFANLPILATDSIFSTIKPTIANARSYEDGVLRGVTTTFRAGDCFAWAIDSIATFTALEIEMEWQQS